MALTVDDDADPDEMAASRRPFGMEPEDAERCDNALFRFTGQIGGICVTSRRHVLVSDVLSGTIWRVDEHGSGTPLDVEGPHSSPRSSAHRPITPAGLDIAPDGTLFVADPSRHRICSISPDGRLCVVAGGANGLRDGPGHEAKFRFPTDVALGADGSCYVADSVNDRIRAISPDGLVTTLAGSNYDYGDGRGPCARFRRPLGLDVDGEGTVYVADTGNNAIRRITPDGAVETVAGQPPGGDADGRGPSVGSRWPSGIVVDAEGSLWVADRGNDAVRHITTGETTALRLSGLRWPAAVAMGDDGTLIVGGHALTDGHMSESCVMLLPCMP